MGRVYDVNRTTKETSVRVCIDLDGQGRHDVATGIGFFDHMLCQLAAHGLFDLTIKAEGDTHVDFHHTVEDVGIALGQALAGALGERQGIRRYGDALAPMDEALAQVALDCSGRAHLTYEDNLPFGKVGEMDIELFREFFEAVARNGQLTLHARSLAGRNAHHVVEAVFKAFARALRQAVEIDPRRTGVPSTKGTL
jgi:imidazoleglycerol-phosphate dehydratase